MLATLERPTCRDCRENVAFDERRITILGALICGDCARLKGGLL